MHAVGLQFRGGMDSGFPDMERAGSGDRRSGSFEVPGFSGNQG